MKLLISAHMIAFAAYGCSLTATKHDVRPFIPGVYARHYKDEYTDSYDTIIIRLIVSSASNGYSITKRSRFERLNDYGKAVPGYEIKKWTGTYEVETKTILLQSTGKRIYFDPLKNELKIGTEPYKKL